MLNSHYLLPHGNCLTMAELEFSMLARQCLGQRTSDCDTLATEIAASETTSNE